MLWLLVKVTLFVELCPTAVLGKVRLVGLNVSGATPVPVSVTSCGLLPALSAIVSAPVTAPGVLGVNVTFVTTLERNPQGPGGPPPGDNFQGQDGMPIILGTSQVQVVTGQDGLASITPNVGSLGPCDAFVTVTAGSATAQFELESLDPISSAQQQPVRRKQPPRTHSFPTVGSASAAAQEATSALFAVPQEMPGAEPSSSPCSNTSGGVWSDPGASTVVSGSGLNAAEPPSVATAQPCDSSGLPNTQTSLPSAEPRVDSAAEAPKVEGPKAEEPKREVPEGNAISNPSSAAAPSAKVAAQGRDEPHL